MFRVVGADAAGGYVEIQYFDADVEDLEMDAWREEPAYPARVFEHIRETGMWFRICPVILNLLINGMDAIETRLQRRATVRTRVLRANREQP